jgi:hypothetical protein
MENTMNNGAINEGTIAKAHAILKARFPHLSAENLNFEKRTGNFFVATMATDENGDEKMSRKVVEDANIPQECHEEMNYKRAAAFVLAYDAKAASADAVIAECEKKLADAKAYRDELFNTLAQSETIVNACALPEKAERVTLAKQVESQAAEIERLKALLAASGIEA